MSDIENILRKVPSKIVNVSEPDIKNSKKNISNILNKRNDDLNYNYFSNQDELLFNVKKNLLQLFFNLRIKN